MGKALGDLKAKAFVGHRFESLELIVFDSACRKCIVLAVLGCLFSGLIWVSLIFSSLAKVPAEALHSASLAPARRS